MSAKSQNKSPKPALENTNISYDNDTGVDNAGVMRKNFMEAFGETQEESVERIKDLES